MSYASLPTNAAVAPYQQIIQQSATKYNVPWQILVSVIQQESSFNANTPNSSAGAIGIAQFMPQTARHFNIDPHDPNQSIDAAANYLSQLHDNYGSWQAAAKHYNGSGPQADAYSSEVMQRAIKLGYDPNSDQTTNITDIKKWLQGAMAIVNPAAAAGAAIGSSGVVQNKLSELWDYIRPHLFALLGFIAGAILILMSLFNMFKANVGTAK